MTPFALQLQTRTALARFWTCANCRFFQPPSQGSQPSRPPSSAPATRQPGRLYPGRARGKSFVSEATRRICGNRSYSSRSRSRSGKGYSSGDTNNGSNKRRTLYLASAGAGTATVTALAFTDEIKQGYETVERVGRVAVALAACINDYRTTLNKKDQIEDPDEGLRILKQCHKRCAERTLRVLEKNGGIFIKLGQHLSAMNYLLPPEWTTTFIPLQDRCPVSSFESIQAMFREDSGSDLFDFFSDFAPEPIGAASLAQVHMATIKETGQKVAVKVQHPELAQWAPLDLSLTTATFNVLKHFFPEYDLSWLSSEMEISLPQELDFRREAENAMRTKEHFSHLPELPLVIPDVIWAQKRILVMACETGHRLDDLDYLDANGIDRDEVSACLSRIFNEMIFSPGAPLHCDPHGGNIAIRKNSRRSGRGGKNFDVILYDHGLYRDIPLSLRRSYAKMWLAVLDGDMERMRQYVREVAGIDDSKFELFASAITGRDFTVVSGEARGGIMAPRTSGEKDTITGALQDGLLSELVQLLGQVPRIILLILKTNDLTRSLDESLHTRQGPVRTFLILARYCSRTVWLEQLEEIGRRGSLWWPGNAVRLVAAWVCFLRVEIKLEAFELYITIRRLLRMGPVMGGAPGALTGR